MGIFRFHDEKSSPAFDELFPLRAAGDILFGGMTFEERWRLLLPEWFREDGRAERVLVANRLAIPSIALAEKIRESEAETLFVETGGAPLAARVRPGPPPERALSMGDAYGSLPVEECEGSVVETPWEMIRENGVRLTADEEFLGSIGPFSPLAALSPSLIDLPPFPGVERIGRGSVRIGRDSHIEPFVLLDTREGPIRIGDRVKVESHCRLRGPLCLRNDSIVRAGARIGDGTTVGEGCRVGGEIGETIFGAFSNKQHEGFLGHAMIGEWVNLGADTNNSDLKNNYGPVRLDWGDGPVDTGQRKLGCFLGDHVKTAIGTRIGTGTVVGAACNLFGRSGFVSGYVPPFTWGEEGGLHDFSRAVDTMNRTMARRERELTAAGRPTTLGSREREILEKMWKGRSGAG